jgi:hypothetical protein
MTVIQRLPQIAAGKRFSPCYLPVGVRAVRTR